VGDVSGGKVRLEQDKVTLSPELWPETRAMFGMFKTRIRRTTTM